MTRPPQVQIASDASAKGTQAAFGGVLEFPDGVRVEVSGPLPRSEHQEATAALATLRHLPPGTTALLQVDAQEDVLRAVLCITHPGVTVTRLPRNSSPLHERAHDLARAALKAQGIAQSAPTGQMEPKIAVYAHQSVDNPAPRYAVAYWSEGEVQTKTGQITAQQTRALTLRMLQEQAEASVPVGYEAVEARYATTKHARPEWAATRDQLAALRSECARALSSGSTGD